MWSRRKKIKSAIYDSVELLFPFLLPIFAIGRPISQLCSMIERCKKFLALDRTDSSLYRGRIIHTVRL